MILGTGGMHECCLCCVYLQVLTKQNKGTPSKYQNYHGDNTCVWTSEWKDVKKIIVLSSILALILSTYSYIKLTAMWVNRNTLRRPACNNLTSEFQFTGPWAVFQLWKKAWTKRNENKKYFNIKNSTVSISPLKCTHACIRSFIDRRRIPPLDLKKKKRTHTDRHTRTHTYVHTHTQSSCYIFEWIFLFWYNYPDSCKYIETGGTNYNQWIKHFICWFSLHYCKVAGCVLGVCLPACVCVCAFMCECEQSAGKAQRVRQFSLLTAHLHKLNDSSSLIYRFYHNNLAVPTNVFTWQFWLKTVSITWQMISGKVDVLLVSCF